MVKEPSSHLRKFIMSSSTPTFAPDVHYDVVFFLSLLKQSLSLDLTEKIRVIESMPTLSDFQVNALHEVFIEERLSFIHLANQPKENDTDEYEIIKGLMLKHIKQWQEIEQFYDLPPLLSDDELVKGIHDFLIANPDTLEKIKDDDKMSPYLSHVGIDSQTLEQVMADYLSQKDEEDFFFKKIFEEYLRNKENSFDDDEDVEDDDKREDENVKNDNNDDDNNNDKDEDEITLHDTESSQKRPYDFMNQGFANATSPEKISLAEAITDTLDVVIGQDHAVEKLATMLYYHKKFSMDNIKEKIRLKDNKDSFPYYSTMYARQPPILLLGTTGSGKTHLIKSVAKQFQLPITFVDCSVLVHTGIVGVSLDTIGRMVYDNAQGDTLKAEHSIIFLDEFDKLFIEHNNSYGSSIDIAIQLLTVIEGSAPMPIEQPRNAHKEYPSSLESHNMLFILAGSFGVHQKNMTKRIGFNTAHHEPSLNQYDQLYLTELGLPDELAGRIGQIVYLEPLTYSKYAQILYHSPTSPWSVLQNQLKMMHCTITLPEEVVSTLIEQNKASIDKFGARGLYQAFNRLPCITPILRKATEKEYQHFVITLDDSVEIV